MKVVVLVDGEHYPPVVRDAIDRIRLEGAEVVRALFLGGSEKIGREDLASAYGVPVASGGDRDELLCRVLEEIRPDAVIDLSDDPVLSPADRFRLASLTLVRGAVYRGSDFEFRPPPLEPIVTKPSIRIIATGKRTGKTAVAGALARHAVNRGHRPVIVAMGRGGPDPPEVVEATRDLSPAALLELAERGGHAASDYIEDALTARVTTVGCRRVGGGLPGAPFASNVLEGARIAEERPEDLVILEGSGSSVPPVAAATGLICVPAHADPGLVLEHLGPYRVLLADLAVVTLGDGFREAASVEAAIRSVAPAMEIVRTAFRPKPLGEVQGRRVFFCSTAPSRTRDVLKRHLEDAYGCEVVGMSHGLADRNELEREIRQAPPFDVLVTELKAGAVDVAVRIALSQDRDVVFADNELVGDEHEEAFDRLLERARRPLGDRHRGRSEE